MTARLASVAPDVAEALGRTSSASQRAIAVAICEWVVRGVGLVDPRIEAALVALREMRFGGSPVRDALLVLVGDLDQRAWDLQDEVDAGSVRNEEYLDAFALARAASAVWFALDGDALQSATEALYEAQAARGDLAGVRWCVQDLLA